MPDTFVTGAQGFGRVIDVDLRSASGSAKERFDRLIYAAPVEAAPKFRDYGLTESANIMSLTELESRLKTGEPMGAERSHRLHAAFLCGLEGGLEPAVFRRALDAIEALQDSGNVQCYVFTRHLKVAASGLERRYRELRERGTLFFKFDGPGPVFEANGARAIITFNDPLLEIELELQPDILVVDEHLKPPASLGLLAELIPSSPAFAPFLQPESTRFCGVETPRPQILAVGPSRGVFDPELMEADVEAAVLAVKKLSSQKANLPGPALVDPNKCAMCLTCVRLCPHGAMGFHKRAEADPDSCMRCGICAVECPMAAISLSPQSGRRDISQTISETANLTTSGPRIVAFLCSRSAGQALDVAWPTPPDNLTPIILPCAGTVGVEHVLSAFQHGASGVMVAGCFKGNCASVYGTSLAEERTRQVSAMLTEIGVNPSKALFTPIAANMPWALREAVQALERAIGAES
jgi:coenzyme F420-reducing hydrogenase delta subunit/Pyruvate/2-oxoacid:ferredoxin oxidoreductase delta subunit